MTLERIRLGREGERLALEMVLDLGYRVVTANYRCPLGEIDLIARDGDTLVFIEIKTRSSGSIGRAKEAVNSRKRRRLSMVALSYLKSHGGCGVKARFDVVAVSMTGEKPRIEVIRNAFELAY